MTTPRTTRQWRLARRPTGTPTHDDFDLVEVDLPDLEAGTQREGHPCGTAAPAAMLGDRPELTSPQKMPFGATPQILVHAERDRIAPPEYAQDYRNAQLARDVTDIELVVIPGEGHVELVSPNTAAWERQVELIRAALNID